MTKQYRSLIIASTVLILIAGLVLSGWMMKIFARLPLIAFDTMLQANNQVSEEQLKAKVISLEAEVASLLYLKSENELLKSAIDTKNETGIIPIQARIITFDNNFTRSSALVGVGSNLGVKEGQPVIYLGHLVGIVKEVSKDSSKIQFLNDADSKLAISLKNSNSSQGILKSQFGTSLEVDSISKLEPVNQGNNIITSATETIPAGLLVGKVKSVSEGDLFHKIIVDYPINFYQLNEVFILKT
ncbi:rod shape-determining protein MreC [bacterium]|nr:rod shape-determining protein MreC [Candidatus Elulimicrobium humile]